MKKDVKKIYSDNSGDWEAVKSTLLSTPQFHGAPRSTESVTAASDKWIKRKLVGSSGEESGDEGRDYMIEDEEAEGLLMGEL